MSSTDLGEFAVSDYGYHVFFSSTNKQENDTIKLNFKVKAPRDAHILLSPTHFPEEESPVYEIVLGAGENTFSTIRRKQLGEDKAYRHSEESLVSPDEWRGFWIEMKGNKIQVGRKGSSAFMEWQDPEPLTIKYYSFCCWNDATANFRIN
ncbi:C3 and PZP-like alpha-2-macroglobulin domain-containing protein 8 [Planococcus citri]|uniref:C3 and PZP-like alpha-2-macroglobulin domain-containing protein 8 n=1 Tax=Planococcus citri TaxID=170843 RepID=UPI0031F854FD